MNYKQFGAGITPANREALAWVFNYGNLPPIRGKWFVVDPNTVNKTEGSILDWVTAYGLCVDERGDGILLMSSGNTSAETTSYMTYPLDWTKEGITVVGACAPISVYQRSRVASKSITSGSIDTIAFPTTTTITDSDSGFLTAGFAVGQTIVIDTTSNSNDRNAIITAVTAGTITCSASTFTVETATECGDTTLSNYLAYLVDVQAANCSFNNFSIGNWLETAQDLGCVINSGDRNYFGNVHMVGAGNATPGAVAGAYDLKINGAQDSDYVGCTFGTDTIVKDAANGEVLIDGGAWRQSFTGCSFTMQSTTAGKVAVKSADAGSFSGIIDFQACKFKNWNPTGITAIDDVFGGTDATSGDYLVTPDCVNVGFTGWGSRVYVGGAAAAASAGGQIATAE